MPDRPPHADPPDPDLIALHEEHHVRYWASRLGVSRNQLAQAIDAVGAAPVRVEAWLKYRSQVAA